jgi:hypothetical protein
MGSDLKEAVSSGRTVTSLASALRRARFPVTSMRNKIRGAYAAKAAR